MSEQQNFAAQSLADPKAPTKPGKYFGKCFYGTFGDNGKLRTYPIELIEVVERNGRLVALTGDSQGPQYRTLNCYDWS